MLKVFNSLSRQKEEFVPIEPGKVRMYVCGMTVYDFCHVGHARVMVVFDVVYRYLMAKGFDVTYVRNITDIDDKIIKRANENGEDIYTLTRRFIDAMHEDADALGVLRPTLEPKATDSMHEILGMIQTLMDKGYAYPARNGDVYYDVSRFEPYGKLSGKQLEDLQAGARVEVDEIKDDPLDFVLWKHAKVEEPSWHSPWGDGRPGWHIECSAMSTRHLGEHFDIHGGGMDLQFPHHENEIAQSEACTGHKYVNYWMHNGFVRINEEKMSKSLGNFFTVREVLARYKAEEVRYFILTSHYRSPLNYSDESLDNARAALNRLYNSLRDCHTDVDIQDDKLAEFEQRFMTAMDDDFNTPVAMSVLFELSHETNKFKQAGDMNLANQYASQLKHLAAMLGLLQQQPEAYLQQGAGQEGLSNAEIDALLAERNQARADKNWAEADRIRDVLNQHDILIEDAATGASWRRK